MVKIISDSDQDKLIERLKKYARKSKGWNVLNKAADKILKKNLLNSEFLKFYPASWLPELFRAYLILRMNYWTTFRMRLQQNSKGLMLSFLSIKNPLYLRIVSLLIRITADRIGIEDYDKLDQIPIDRKYHVPTHCPYDMLPNFLEDIVFEYIDFITHDSAKKILEFFEKAVGKPKKFNYLIDKSLLIPSSIIQFSKSSKFFIEISKKYKDLIEKEIELEEKSQDPESVKLLNKIQEPLENLIDKYREKLKDTFDFDSNEDNQSIATFTNDGIGKMDEVMKEFEKEFVHLQSNFEDFDVSDFPVFRVGSGEIVEIEKIYFLKFMQHNQFSTTIMEDIISHLYDNYSEFVEENDSNEFKKILNFYRLFLTKPSADKKAVEQLRINEIYKNLLNSEVFIDVFNELVYDPTKVEAKLSDPISAKELFRFSSEIFLKPFIHDRRGCITFSFYLLFDALIFNYTKKLRSEIIGRQRGIHTENYLIELVNRFANNRFKSDYFKVFKLILQNSNSDHRGNDYQKVINNLNDFKAEVYKIDLSPQEFGNQFSFVEYDFLINFKNTLIIVEVKDDLFWELIDFPHLLILWGRNLNEKIKRQENFLKQSTVKMKLSQMGIIFEKIESIVITQGNVFCPDFKTINDLYDLLDKINIGKTHYKTIVFENLPDYKK